MSVIKQVEVNDGVNTPVTADIGAEASNVSFSNTSSEMTATDVQAAINEIVAQNGYAVCETAANTVAKTVTITNFKLRKGVQVVIKFANGNTVDNPTLNISETGAKAISLGNAPSWAFDAGTIYLVTYNGTGFEFVGGSGSLDGFIGTKDEWDNLSTAEKNRYNGKLVIITDDFAPEGAGGGHVILDENNTEFTQRDELKFGEGFVVTDDSTNGRTIVTPHVQYVTQAEYDLLPAAEKAAGTFYITDGDSEITNVDQALSTESGNPIANAPVATAINQINSNLTANDLGQYIGLNSYTSASNKYTFLSDGYVRLQNTSGQTSKMIICGTTDTNAFGVGGAEGSYAVFVRKGMRVYRDGTGYLDFNPIV